MGKIKLSKTIARKIFILVLFGCLMGCSSNLYVKPSPSVVPATEIVEITLQPDQPNSLPNTPTPYPTLPPNNTPTVEVTSTVVREQEPTIGEGVSICSDNGKPKPLPDGFGFNGTIVYQESINEGIYTIGGKPIRRGQLPIEQGLDYFVFGFSPDNEWLAYWPTSFIPGTDQPILDTAKVQLLSAKGALKEQTLDLSTIKKEFGSKYRLLGFGLPSYWINDHLIFTTIYFQPDNDRIPSRLSSMSKIFDPFEGQWHDEILSGLPGWTEHSAVSFSPDLKRVFYEGAGFVLLNWDMLTPLWIDGEPIADDAFAAWAPDSSYVAYIKNVPSMLDQQFSILSSNGKRQRLIHQYSSLKFYIWDFRWSPNSQYIAFSGKITDGDVRLFVYDVLNNRYTYNCILHGYEENPPSIVWSPDSSLIALSGWDEPLQLFDLQTGEIFSLLSNVSAVGWSDSFPVTLP